MAADMYFEDQGGQGGSRGRTGAAGTKESGKLAATQVCEEEGFKITQIDEAIEKLQVMTPMLHLLDMTQKPSYDMKTYHSITYPNTSYHDL